MAALPSGVITFVFTDVEGSTSILQRLGDVAYSSVLAEHNRILREAFHEGVEVGTEGDSFFYVFTSAVDAVQAAIEGQQALAGHPWPEGGIVRVRMGLHTGEARPGGDNYAGIDVNRAARISAAAHGGQILLTEATKVLGSGGVGGSSLRDLGLHRFKGVDQGERVYQVVTPGLPAEFPPIRSLDSRPHNLPERSSQLIGRARETVEVADLLDQSRLVTLTGPGGNGKSRLAIHVASEVIGNFEHGVVYVPLDGVREHDRVMAAIADVAKVSVEDGRGGVDSLAEYFYERSALLVLDTFEHLLPAAVWIGELLDRTRRLRVLVSSQSLLRIRGERAYPVPPLSPDEGIDLLVARAREVDPAFQLGEQERGLAAQLVKSLDHSPLAIELAAARIRLFGLSSLAARLAGHLDMASSLLDTPTRHRTLRAAIQWSYDLLDSQESDLLRRLSVFRGGFLLDAAERVAPGLPVVEGVASLLDKSLIDRRLHRGEARFYLLDTISQFASEELAASGDRDEAQRLHAGYYAGLAESALALLEGPDQTLWMERFAVEHDNLRSVAAYSFESGDPDPALKAFGGAWRFFHRRGHLTEAVATLRRLLAMPQPGTLPARILGLNGLAALLYWQGQYEQALATYHELLPLTVESGDRYREAETLFGLSTTYSFVGDLDAGMRHADLAKEAYADSGSPEDVRRVWAAQAFAIWMGGDLESAVEGWTHTAELYREAGDWAEVLQSRTPLAIIKHLQGDTPASVQELGEILHGFVDIADVSGTVMILDIMAAIAANVRPSPAAILGGAAAALRVDLGGGLTPQSVRLASAREIIEPKLGAEETQRLWKLGSDLDLEGAIDAARAIVDELRATVSSQSPP